MKIFKNICTFFAIPTLAFCQTNVVYIMADDLGWKDLGIHGSDIPTPHIDAFFRESVELEQFMSSPVCSPTRAGFLTGIHPMKTNSAPIVDGQLDDEKYVTIAESFQDAGYQTGAFGKWHNGEAVFRDEAGNTIAKPENFKRHAGRYTVNDHGFDEWVGFYAGGCDYITKEALGIPQWFHNDLYVPLVWDTDTRYSDDKTGYVTDLLADYATKFIEESHLNGDDFFCYIPFLAPHSPIMYKDAENPDHRIPIGRTTEQDRMYAELIIYLDDAVGQVLATLDRLGLRENTIVVFTSDNGGSLKYGANNDPFHEGKHHLTEGGIRVPSAIRYPERHFTSDAGSPKIHKGLVTYLDMYPTLFSLCGLTVPAGSELPLDGRDLSAEIQETVDLFSSSSATTSSEIEEPSSFTADPNYYINQFRGRDVVRTKRFKYFRWGEGEFLFDLATNLDEDINADRSLDVSSTYPVKFAELKGIAQDFIDHNEFTTTHVPYLPDVETLANPSGKVLKVTVNKTESFLDKHYAFRLSSRSRGTLKGNYYEYDIMVPSSSSNLWFNKAMLVNSGDNFADLLMTEYAFDNEGYNHNAFRPNHYVNAIDHWKRYRIGLGSRVPVSTGSAGIVINKNSPVGEYTFYIDNIVMRNLITNTNSTALTSFNFWTEPSETGLSLPSTSGISVTVEAVDNPLPITDSVARSKFLNTTAAKTVTLGQAFTASVTFQNTGQATWRASDDIRLVNQDTFASQIWGISEVPLPVGAIVPPGASYTFHVPCIAPEIHSTYNFLWRLESPSGAFGDLSANHKITVEGYTPETVLRSGEVLTAGNKIVFPDQNRFLAMQHDGNLVLLQGTPGSVEAIVWSSHSSQHILGDYFVRLQHDGHLIIHEGTPSAAGSVIFKSFINSVLGNYYLCLEGDSLSVYKKENAIDTKIWSNIYENLVAGERFQPGQMIRNPELNATLILQGDGSLVVYEGTRLDDFETALWTSDSTTPHSPQYLQLQHGGRAVIYCADESNRLVATWNEASGAEGKTLYHLRLGSDTRTPEFVLGYPLKR